MHQTSKYFITNLLNIFKLKKIKKLKYVTLDNRIYLVLKRFLKIQHFSIFENNFYLILIDTNCYFHPGFCVAKVSMTDPKQQQLYSILLKYTVAQIQIYRILSLLVLFKEICQVGLQLLLSYLADQSFSSNCRSSFLGPSTPY